MQPSNDQAVEEEEECSICLDARRGDSPTLPVWAGGTVDFRPTFSEKDPCENFCWLEKSEKNPINTYLYDYSQ